MAYYMSGISDVRVAEYDGALVVSATTEHQDDKVLQCYVSGQLVSAQRPAAGAVQFVLPEIGHSGLVAIVAVDGEEANTDYSRSIFPSAASGNRIEVRTPREMRYLPGCRWKVYRGEPGEQSADALLHEQEVCAGARRCCGYGAGYGDYYGFDAADAPGYGYCYGYDYGFGCEQLTWESEPLPCGTYPIKVTVADEAGNESTAYETSVTISTYPRPARNLTVQSYTKETDTLSLAWTASEDI
jgi:hypothetical protein